MSYAAIRFPSVPWASGAHPLERKKSDPEHPVTLLEFAPGFGDPNWCARGHTGYVLEGSLSLEFEDRVEPIGTGEGFVIDPGTRHRASNPGAVPVRLFIVSHPGG
jgi:quercetin dioxygenase-like cupin family protein